MAITYTHKVKALKKDSNDIVKSFTLSVTASSGGSEYNSEYNVILEPTGSSTITYSSLTENNIINWYLSSSVETDRIQTNLEQNLFNSVTSSFPWS